MATGIKRLFQEIIALSHTYGQDPDFVLAGGGNTSFKTKDRLYVKASGTTLGSIDTNGFVAMSRARLDRIWQKKLPSPPKAREKAVLSEMMAAREPGEEHKRPSVEALLHNMIGYRLVVHTHPALVNGVTCCKNGRRVVRRRLGPTALWIPYTDPGYTLAARVKREIEKYAAAHHRSPQIIVLENHGLVIAADTAGQVKKLIGKVIKKLAGRVKRKPDFAPVPFDRQKAAGLAPAIRMLVKEGDTSIVTFCANHEIQKLVASKSAFYPVSSAFTPDHIVYYKPEPLFVRSQGDPERQYRELQTQIKTYRAKHGFYPRIIAVEKLGVFAAAATKKAADIALTLFRDAIKIAVYTRAFGRPQFMTKRQIDFITTWEAESYRQKVSVGSGSARVLQEKIAVVTGGAQGFGLGIAQRLAAKGANVVLADINFPLADQMAGTITRQEGKGKALACGVDVGNERSVEEMVLSAVLEYGGIDVLVNNAGILKAGSLEEMDLGSFERVTKINYTAYYLCTKYVSRYMKVQHRFDPAWYSDIIQINSKSGLAGSNKNFTYAGGKFGGIGLTQSFALELVDHNIKVNSICPGNFFEGPLWSDPKNGLFVQYLKAGKVPGARTIQDVKRFYESKVPMGRGCRVEDVVKAIIYTIEQQYETGQAVPVTGGQIMLK